LSTPLRFALNHMTAPRLDSRRFIELAAGLGCVGIELRNDLADKQLTTAPFFDGEAPATIGALARARGLRLLGLSEVYGFNAWSDAIAAKVQALIDQAVASGAETISLIPRNDAPTQTDGERAAALREALAAIRPMLEAAGLVALVEPLGFPTSSLRHKSEAIEAIAAVGGLGRFKLVHDTFHHHLAGGGPLFPEMTGIVHISGVADPEPTVQTMQDRHRILVDGHDRLGTVAQIRALREAGYDGAFSFEPFAPSVHALADPAPALRASFEFIAAAMA